MKKKIALILILSSFFLLSAENLKKNPQNVVGLSKSVSQMWLLSGGKLVGTTEDSFELENIGNAISVGTLTTTNLEAIVSLNPDLVILTLDIPVHKKISENLQNLGIKTYIVDVKKFDDYKKVMKDFTDLTEKKDLYQKNVLDVENQIKKIVEKNHQKNKGKTYLFFRVSSTKNKVLKNHFGNEIFTNLGLKSVVKNDNSLDELSIEAILNENPDYIFVVAQGNQKKADEAFYNSFEKNPVWKELKAVKNRNVFMLPKELFNYKPNENWANAYQYIVDLIN